MNGLNVTGTSVQADGTVKILYNATYENTAHVEGFVFLTSDDVADIKVGDLPSKVAAILVEKLTPITTTDNTKETN